MAKTLTYTTGTQDITDPSQVNGVTIRLAGTALATAPILNFENTALGAPATTTYLLGKIEVLGTAATPNFGILDSSTESLPVTLTQGVHVSHGTLVTDTISSSFTLDGHSVVTNGSTLDAGGGRYVSGTYTLNGSIAVGTDSTANLLTSYLAGDGTLKTTAKSATIDIGFRGADSGIHIDLTKGGVPESRQRYELSWSDRHGPPRHRERKQSVIRHSAPHTVGRRRRGLAQRD